MKKTLSMILVSILGFGLCGCNIGNVSTDDVADYVSGIEPGQAVSLATNLLTLPAIQNLANAIMADSNLVATLTNAWADAQDDYVLPAASASPIPIVASIETMVRKEINNRKLSSLHSLDGEVLLVASYDNDTRTNSWLHVLDRGALIEVFRSSAETYGTGDRVGNHIYIPGEHKNGQVIRANISSRTVEKMPFRQPSEYGSRSVEGKCAYIPRGSGKVNELFDMSSGKRTGIVFDRLHGIVTGLVLRDGEWIASVIDGGIQSSAGWHIQCECPELALLGNDVLLFLKNGDVHLLDGKSIGRKIAATGIKPRRAVVGDGICFWITESPYQLWATNGRESKRIHDFGPRADGTLFSSSVSFSDGRLFVGLTIGKDNGFEIYKVTLK